METIDLNYCFPIREGCALKSITVADQKRMSETADEILVQGNLLADLILNRDGKDEIQHEQGEIQIRLAKSRYHRKDLALKLEDYDFSQSEGKCFLNVRYAVEGEDLALEQFCSLDGEDLSCQLRDYLNRDGGSLSQINLDENKIVLLDPVIEEKPIPVEIEIPEVKESVSERPADKKEETIARSAPEIPVEIRPKKESLMEEKYCTSFIFYRVKKGEDAEAIAAKFHLSGETLLKANHGREIKENALIQIPQHV